jgi:hypothetical protein
MNTVESVVSHLSSRFISETSVPTEWLSVPAIWEAIVRFNWVARPSTIIGWTNLARVINYSS